MSVQHDSLDEQYIHHPYRWTVDDETARLALTPESADIKKRLYQLSDKTEWILVSDSPVEWFEAGSKTAAEIKTAYESNADTNAYTDAEKLLVTSALQADDVGTAAAEDVEAFDAAGAAAAAQAAAVQRSNHTGTQLLATISDAGTAAAAATGDFATAAQGAKADTALQPSTAITVTTIDTGQGAVECYAMDQAVLTTSTVTFSTLTINNANIRLSNNFSLVGRNAANTLDLVLFRRDTSDQVNVDPDGYGVVTGGPVSASTHLKKGSYTVATAPSAATAGAGAQIHVTDGNAGARCAAESDGTNWKVIALGATIAAS